MAKKGQEIKFRRDRPTGSATGVGLTALLKIGEIFLLDKIKETII